MLTWTIEEKRLDLIYNWKLSRSNDAFKINFFIKVSDGIYSAQGEVAPNLRYKETPELIKEQFSIFIQSRAQSISDLNSFIKTIDALSLCNSLRFGIESAFIHLLSKKNNKKVYEFLGLKKPEHIKTCYTIPIIEAGKIKEFISSNKLQRFESLKVKVNHETAFEMISETAKNFSGLIKIDANESWTEVEELLSFMNKIKKFNIEFIEQPMPADLADQYVYLKPKSHFELIGDESITKEGDFSLLQKQFHGINIKLMKAGGYMNGIHLLQEARKYQMKTMIGCMVETTLGISSGMNLCSLVDYMDLDGYFLIANEPYGLVKEENGELNFN